MYNQPDEANVSYQKGQRILFKGEEAIVLEVEPVFTVQVMGKNHIVCGNIMGDISPYES